MARFTKLQCQGPEEHPNKLLALGGLNEGCDNSGMLQNANSKQERMSLSQNVLWGCLDTKVDVAEKLASLMRGTRERAL